MHDLPWQLEYPTCAACGIDLRRPFLCLSCAYPGCLFRDPVRDPSLPVTRGKAGASDGTEEGSSHIGLHLAEEAHPYGTWPMSDLTTAFDIIHGTLFCSACDDVVYDPRFEYILQCETHRTHVPCSNERALDALMMNDARTPKGTSLPSICRTPRGLRNMGATCFLNVILQSFLHNPLLRNYFLSDQHNSALCAAGRDCLACEMDKLYKEVRAFCANASSFAHLTHKARTGRPRSCMPFGWTLSPQRFRKLVSTMRMKCLSAHSTAFTTPLRRMHWSAKSCRRAHGTKRALSSACMSILTTYRPARRLRTPLTTLQGAHA